MGKRVATASARAKLARLAAALNAGRRALPALILLTDDERLPDPQGAARLLPKGSMVIVRARNDARREALVAALAPVCRARVLILIVAGDPRLAGRSGAAGIHCPEARHGEIRHWRSLRPSWRVIASAHSLRACLHAAHCGAHAVLLSPVFATRSHPERAPLSPLRLRAIASAVPVPVYALGGIDSHTAPRLAGAKLAGLAAIGALAP
jgi:thiamine-phosphate pyrophosphorylase